MYRPDFLNRVDYPLEPFGLFHIIGREFRGFHIRFRDIARGGIRIVRSAHLQNYLTNSDFIFDENYNLASTQQRKNKDLPDGGSKGTILLRWGFQDRPEAAFKKYIDGLLDLMLPDPSVVDLLRQGDHPLPRPRRGHGRPHGVGGPPGQGRAATSSGRPSRPASR